jgi:hypothetical protein
MPSHKQVTVEAVVTNKDRGRHDSKAMSTIFKASPIHASELTADSVRKTFQDLVLDGEVNDAGHTFGIQNRDYIDAPDYGDVETGGGGLPASPWAPNPSSPGPGSQNPADQAEAPDGYGTKAGDTWGSGVGSQLSPKSASAKISGHTLGDYGLGKSSPG